MFWCFFLLDTPLEGDVPVNSKAKIWRISSVSRMARYTQQRQMVENDLRSVRLVFNKK